jgi:hypothetical protein
MKNTYRYSVQISFKRGLGLDYTEPVKQDVKTLKEARSYKVLLDNSVSRACVVDHVTGLIVEKWVGWDD